MTDKENTGIDDQPNKSAVDADRPAPEATPPPWPTLARQGKLDDAKKSIVQTVTGILQRHGLQDMASLILYDENGSISNYDANALYSAASAIPQKSKDILLIIHSSGGAIEPAYLISKTLKRLSKEKFVVVVPRKAKSAATLMSLGADEIHMGYVSQLGPIDPQIGGLPVLALGDALDSLAEAASKFPASAEMLGKYLASQAPIRLLGYYKRIGESAVQYAERLLRGKTLADGKTARGVADQLVNHYKDHGFVIDFDEATTMLGNSMIRTASSEYAAADEIFKQLDYLNLVLDRLGKRFWYIGGVQDGLHIYDKPKDDD